jgi:hypothetical protein
LVIISHESEKDIGEDILSYNRAVGIVNQVFEPNSGQINTGIRVYKTLARSMLIYGSEAWTVCKGDESRIATPEMKFVRRTTDYIHSFGL